MGWEETGKWYQLCPSSSSHSSACTPCPQCHQPCVLCHPVPPQLLARDTPCPPSLSPRSGHTLFSVPSSPALL